MADTPEVKVKKQIDKLLKKYEYIQSPWEPKAILWWFKPSAGAYGKAGIPDYIGCIDGSMFGIEVKANDGQLTIKQGMTLVDIENSGGHTFVIRGFTDGRPITFSSSYNALELFLRERTAVYIARRKLTGV